MRKENLLRFSFLFAYCLFVVCGHSQTKLIAHKSHSGSNASFSTAYNNNWLDLEDSNFGMAPERTVTTASLDSLIFISDSAAIMVTSERCNKMRQQPNRRIIWKAGRDTVYNHHLFNKKNEISYIKAMLKRSYYFQNPVDSIRFINENKDEVREEYQHVFPAAPGDDDNHHSKPNPMFWIASLFIFSLMASLFYYLFGKLQPAIASPGVIKA